MKTALYIRVSSRDQVQRGVSIPDQLARLRETARHAGETIVDEFVDQARSGTSIAKRKEYQRLLAAARVGEFQRVRVESVDRGHRNDMERRAFETEMATLSIQVIYCGEPEQQAPAQRKLQRGIRGVLAEWESDETSERTYKRHLYRAKQGKWRGGTVPYGIVPDGAGWFEPEPASYDALLWILERRAEGLGYHSIAKRLNQGISLNNEPAAVPPTAGLLAYQRKPYLEQQDPETGDIMHLPRRVPSAAWGPLMVRRICQAACDGVYAGVLHWGRRYNRFREDATGLPKIPVRIETGNPLVPDDLLRRVQTVEISAQEGIPQTMAVRNTFLLELECGLCGAAMHGYTSTKIKPSGKKYRYRKYRCAGRANKAGSCRMPILSADQLEAIVLDAVFNEAKQRAPKLLAAKIVESVTHARAQLLVALETVQKELQQQTKVRNDAMDAVLDRSISPALRQAFVARAEEAVATYQELEQKQRTLQVGIETLDARAKIVTALFNSPLMDLERRDEPEVYQALKRALHLLVHKAVLMQHDPSTYSVKLWLYRLDDLMGREISASESAWGSNPPARLVTPPTYFEDKGDHRAASALGAIVGAQQRTVNKSP